MKYLLFITFAIALLSCNSNAPQTIAEDGELNWLTIDELSDISNPDGKMVLVDMYTSWCGWCKRMDKQTFTDGTVKDYLSDKYLVVKFDAERKSPVNFLGKEYGTVAKGRKGTNGLAVEMMGGRLAYPTLVVLDKELKVKKALPGYKTPEQLISTLQKLEG